MAQRSKGPRGALTVRVPEAHKKIFRKLAEQAGVSTGDYLAAVLADAHGLERPEYVRLRGEEVAPLPFDEQRVA